MPLDELGLEAHLDAGLEGQLAAPLCHHLCRSQRAIFQEALKPGAALAVGCTQEAPLFELMRDELCPEAAVSYFNIREMAGWSAAAEKAGPKVLSLIAKAQFEMSPITAKELSSDGMCLIYGEGDEAFEIAKIMAQHLPVTLLLKDEGDTLPFLHGGIPVARGVIRRVTGRLGCFDVVIEDYAPAKVSSRGALLFEAPEPLKQASAALILDLTSGAPLYRKGAAPTGYFRGQTTGGGFELLALVAKIIDLKGKFEKPHYIHYRPEICAHGANQITACTKCIDHCPLSAVRPFGDKVAFDAGLCEGCGACAALCPTGAVTYQYPRVQALYQLVDLMLSAYFNAGGDAPHLLCYASGASGPVIEALARFGKGLPAFVLPFDLHQVTSLDHTFLLMALARGAARLTLFVDEERAGELDGLEGEVALASAFYNGLFPGQSLPVDLLITNDPDRLEEALWPEGGAAMKEDREGLRPARLYLEGERRQIFSLVMAALLERSEFEGAQIVLPRGAPYGAVVVNEAACTLCLSCVNVCPTSALGDHPERPQLTFKEISCVQCGLCQKTCPEGAITLSPRYNFSKAALSEAVLKEEAPFHCVRCGKPFGVKSTIEKITEKLAAKHWMFEREDQIALIKMCDQCRVVHLAEAELGGGPRRPGPRMGGGEEA